LWGEVVCQRKPIIVNNFEAPNDMKKGYPKGHVQITKFMSIPVIIEGKIVAVVGLANKEYDYDNNDVYQIIALMNGVWNAKERREALVDLAIERNRFLQTLISIGDGVLVVDMEGKVTMLNKVAEKLTGWTTKEAVGRHYKDVFVLSHEDEKSIINDPIEGVINTNIVQELGNHAMLTSKDGTKYFLEDSAAPIKDDKDKTIGVVLVFRDVTEKKEQRRKIEYLSFHDSLTGLYNRMFFDEELKRLDTERNLPLSIIVGDVNGLKLTNDIFGHEAGDQLLQKMAEAFKKVCRADDIIARVGGDEFTLLLPKTTEEEANEIISRVRSQFAKMKVKAIKGSISMGCDAKTKANDDIQQTLRNAEKRMYSAKAIDREVVKTTTIGTIIETLHNINSTEAEHSRSVSEICENIGLAMNLTEVEIRKVKEAGFLHDIGKIALSENLLNKKENLTEQEQKELNQHPITGYRILNSFDSTLDLAESILAHHEKWDGSGYPKGLKGEEIPKLARIIAVAESYDTMTRYANMTCEEAVNELRKQDGIKFDPAVVDVFIKMIMH
jgi:diguanylate cyclase (GGDEF)-like protein/PAS domain S-box-containing protein